MPILQPKPILTSCAEIRTYDKHGQLTVIQHQLPVIGTELERAWPEILALDASEAHVSTDTGIPGY